MLLPSEPFSTPQLVRYFPGQKYDLHTDFWPEHQVVGSGPHRGRLFNRVASFFVFLRSNCTGGYTNFPMVEPMGPGLRDWFGEKVAVGEMEGRKQGLKFRPLQGNAVFWVNIDKKGRGDRRVVHAGLPVGEGEKIGLNIWPRKWYGWEEGAERKDEGGKGWSGKWKE
jgi:prolyl 4-hydroxylase